MPKALSLRKTNQTGPSKNQKPITQFFKNANPLVSQQNPKSPNKSLPSTSNGVEKKTTKREATSPIVLETIEIEDDICSTSGTSTNQALRFHPPKKIKSDNTDKSPIKNGAAKKSPQKENTQINQNCTKNNTDNDSESKHNYENHRSPLTPIKVSSNQTGDEINSRISDNSNHEALLANGEHKCATQATNDLNETKVTNHDIKKKVTPKKVLQFADSKEQVQDVLKTATPKKSPAKVLLLLRTPEKLSKDELSPSKSGSTVKTRSGPRTLDGFSPGNFDDLFDLDKFDEKEDLDLNTMQRCEVISTSKDNAGGLRLRLTNENGNRATCYVEGIWKELLFKPGTIISVIATRNSSGQFCVNNSAGLVSLWPDHLMSATSVVAGVFCKRKAVLQELYRGLDSGNTAMTVGILIHELVQKALTQHIMDVNKLRTETESIIKNSIQILYEAGISEDEARSNMEIYIQPLADFMQTYMSKSPLSKKPQKDQWNGQIDKVLDIEENLCCPQLGLKGKIDATLQVTIHERKGRERAVVPLELKSGKASVSAEHRGQLVLYGMMLALARGDHPATTRVQGLLLYLKERVDLREVSCGYPERRDLVMLRNQLVQNLVTDYNPEKETDIEDVRAKLQQKLPEPIRHHSACAKCPYLTTCSLHLWHTEGGSVSAEHLLSKLRDEAIGHLSPQHIEYFLHWGVMLRAEELIHRESAPLHALWTDSADKRAKRGTCAANLNLKSVAATGDRYLHLFEKRLKAIDSLNSSKTATGPQEGEFSIVSIDNRPWIAAGVVTLANEKEISIILERDLSCRLSKDIVFHIDTYESYATTVHNRTNLGALLEDSERSERLRKFIIDKQPPVFDKKLPREVGRLGTKLMRSLNIDQQRAVLKAVAAKDYALLQGLPGTGKTQTISVLIQMLVGLKQRVLVTAHTHSAVDTVLSRLPDSLKVMRLGSAGRVAPALLHRCEHHLIAKCENAKQLEELYASMEVVGVTCLGAAAAAASRVPFHVCIVDEATQVLQSTVLRPLLAAARFVLVGDPDQLPPVVRSRVARRLGMEESLFHRLMTEEATSTLQLQYRMNRPLADIANNVAYNSKLKCADHRVAEATIDIDVVKISHKPAWLQSACNPELDKAALFLDTKSIETTESNIKSCTNVNEACLAMALVETLIQGGVKPADIGIIAPYRDQVCLLRRALYPRGVDCSTVDQFQGRDKSVILYSCTKQVEKEDRKVKEGDILSDQRRLAVSVTRAKHKLLIIGNSRALQRYAPLQKLIESCPQLVLDREDLNSVVDSYKQHFL